MTLRPVEGDLQRVLGANLRSQRLARELSQEAFADVLGVHRTYLGALERGEKNVSLRSLERLAERLDLPPLALLEEATHHDARRHPETATNDVEAKGAAASDA